MSKSKPYNHVKAFKKYKNETDFFDKYEFVVTDEEIVNDYKLAIEQLGNDLANYLNDLLGERPDLFSKELYEYTLKTWLDQMILNLFCHYNGNISKISGIIGLSRPTLRHKLKQNDKCLELMGKKRN